MFDFGTLTKVKETPDGVQVAEDISISELKPENERVKPWYERYFKPKLDDKERARAVVELVEKEDEVEPTPMQSAIRAAERYQPLSEDLLKGVAGVTLFPLYAAWDRLRSAAVAKIEGEDIGEALVLGGKRISDIEKLNTPEATETIRQAYKTTAKGLTLTNPLFKAGETIINEAIDSMSGAELLLGVDIATDILGMAGVRGAVGAVQSKALTVGKVTGNLNEAYNTLGVKPGTPPKDIHKAYRRLMVKNHPDKVGGSVEMAQKINGAFDQLREALGSVNFYCGVPVPKEIIDKFGLTSKMVAGIMRGDVASVPAAALEALNQAGYFKNIIEPPKPEVPEPVTNPLTESARKAVAEGKTVEEFVMGYNLFHGTPAKIEGGKLKFGAGEQLKKGGYMGGHFLTDQEQAAQAFQFGGEIYRAEGAIKEKVFDVNKNKKMFKDFIGKKFKNQDGEMETFTKEHYEFMFPDGEDADWSTVYTDVAEYIAKPKGFDGIKIKEYAGGVDANTYQLWKDEIPVYRDTELRTAYDKAKAELGEEVEAKKKAEPKVIPTAIDKINKFKERLKDPDIKRRKDVQEEAEAITRELKKSKLLNTFRRRQIVEKINKMKGISTPEGRAEFSEYLDSVIKEIETVQKRRDVKENIAKRKLQRVENLRKASKLPPVNKMTLEQLNEFIELLEPYQEGDIFLTQRQIETVDNTDLEGIRTLREAREKFAKEAGITVTEAMGIKVGILDRVRSDIRLMEQNPLYKMLVENTHKAFIGADVAFRDFERKLEELTIAARNSKKRTLADRLVPTDELVFNWLEAEDKASIESQMTAQELELAVFLRDEYAKALQYLIEQETLKTGIDNYVTNVRRGFFEALKDDGFIAGLKEMFDQYKKDEQVFNILDQATDTILPLEKFFQFAMKRTGNINPTKNVAKAASIYFRTMYKKQALDSFIPKMMIYVQAITPEKTTPRGLEFDQSIKKFVKEWINTKKGRKSQSGLMKQGGPIDIAVLGLKSLITIWDLGINIPVQIAATVGETVAGYVTLGKKNMAKGVFRLNTKQGKKIVEKYEGFTGKSLWRELLEPAKNIGDRTMTAVFGLFASSASRMNKISLLGMMTKEEFKAGKVSAERLTEIKLDIGKMRIISGGKSIGESTTAGGVITQYKTWAIPIFSTMSSDLGNLAKKLKNGEAWGSEELTRLRRAAEVTIAAILLGMAIGDKDDDSSFGGQLLKKVRREALTIMGALDPSIWTAAPRMLQWIEQLGEAIKMIITLEEYKEKPGLKGVAQLKRMLTPRMISMFLQEDNDVEPDREERRKALSDRRGKRNTSRDERRKALTNRR